PLGQPGPCLSPCRATRYPAAPSIPLMTTDHTRPPINAPPATPDRPLRSASDFAREALVPQGTTRAACRFQEAGEIVRPEMIESPRRSPPRQGSSLVPSVGTRGKRGRRAGSVAPEVGPAPEPLIAARSGPIVVPAAPAGGRG